MVFHILDAFRTEKRHEIFDLSHQRGLEDLTAALDNAAALDRLGNLPVPEVPAAAKLERIQKRNHNIDPVEQAALAEAKRQKLIVRARAEEERRQQLKTQKLEKKQEESREERTKKMKRTIDQLYASDALGSCIAKHCTVGHGLSVNATAFLKAFNTDTNSNVKQKTMKDMMTAKNLLYTTKNGAYKGLAFRAVTEGFRILNRS